MNVLIDSNCRRSDQMQDVLSEHGHQFVVINHIDVSNLCIIMDAEILLIDDLSAFSFITHYAALLHGKSIGAIAVLTDGVVLPELMDAIRFRFSLSYVRVIERGKHCELLPVLEEGREHSGFAFGADSGHELQRFASPHGRAFWP